MTDPTVAPTPVAVTAPVAPTAPGPHDAGSAVAADPSVPATPAVATQQLTFDEMAVVDPAHPGAHPGARTDTMDTTVAVAVRSGLRRARLLVAYDGSGYHGFAEATGQRTVMGELRGALDRISRIVTDPVGAGRTDAGVHAWGQVVSVDLPEHIEIDRLAHRLTRLCGPSIVVRAAAWCTDPEFSARFSASYRHYRYHVLNAPTPVPALAGTTWHVAAPLELWAMQLACDPIIGEHHFGSFCRAPKVRDGAVPPSLTRRVLRAEWHQIDSDYGPLLRFEIRANAFCHQMVRSIVGTMVDIGAGRLHAGEMRTILLRGDRAAAGQVAPPQGLSLWEVGYPDPDRSFDVAGQASG